MLTPARRRFWWHAVLTWGCWKRTRFPLGPLHYLAAFFIVRRRPTRRIMLRCRTPRLEIHVVQRRRRHAMRHVACQ